jgi:hypothetical protein
MHRWRHAPDPLKQRALLLYQAQQRRRWHLNAGAADSWSLETINDTLLKEAREDLFNEQRTQQTAIAIQVSFSILSWIRGTLINYQTEQPHPPFFTILIYPIHLSAIMC